jgi:release factor glutamine methyltransferase
VLIPRPETELLVEEARRVLTRKNAETIVDIGTGSGCLAVALASVVPTARIYAVDCSASALEVARKNIARHGVESQVTCVHGDLCMPLKAMGLAGQVDVIVSNPPYVMEAEWPHLQPEVREFEPRSALVGGVTGIKVHSRLLDEAWKYLVPGGWLFMEVGIGQSEAVCRLAVQTGRYADPTVRRDTAGIDRIIRVQSLARTIQQ